MMNEVNTTGFPRNRAEQAFVVDMIERLRPFNEKWVNAWLDVRRRPEPQLPDVVFAVLEHLCKRASCDASRVSDDMIEMAYAPFLRRLHREGEAAELRA